MSLSPLVSVIIPAHNAAPYIAEAVRSALSQTHGHLEVLVVDDGSRDQTPHIVAAMAHEDPRIRLIVQENRGVAAARNAAIEASCGEYIAPLDADDIWYPRKIERQLEAFRRAGPEVGLVYAWWVSIDEMGGIRAAAHPWKLEGEVFEALCYINFIGNASVPLIRRDCLEQVGLYRNLFQENGAQGCEDWDLTLRVAERYAVGVVQEYLVGYRHAKGSMSCNCVAMGRSYDAIMAAVEQQHPEIPEEILRWSRSRFYSYLGALSYNQGRHPDALHWIAKALYWDPLLVLSFGTLRMAGLSLVRAVARPLTSLLWPDHQAWMDFKRRYLLPPPRHFTLEEINQGATKQPFPWTWRPWKPYDRIYLKRWRYVTQERLTHTSSRDSRSVAAPPALDLHGHESY